MERPRFSSILEALGAERLRAHMAAREPLHLPAPPTIDLGTLLSRAEFEDAIVEGRAPRSSLKLYAGYRSIDPGEFGLHHAGGVSRERLRELMARRTTVVATHLDWAVPHLWDFAREAEQALGDSVNLGAIASHGGETGIAPHYDIESLIILQLDGTKKWQFFGTPLAQSCRPKFRTKGAPRPKAAKREAPPAPPLTAELVMRPGDLLYVPPGLRHRCAPEGSSFHLGILIEHQSGRTLLRELRDRMRGDEAFYVPMMRFLGADGAAAQAEDYKARLLALIEASDARELMETQLDIAMRGAAYPGPGAAEPD